MSRPVCWLDLETTGLDPETHEIIEIGAYCNGRVFETKVIPTRLETAEQEALEVNGFTDVEDWKARGAKPLEQALLDFTSWVRYVATAEAGDRYNPYQGYKAIVHGPVVGGHNAAGFDVPFLKARYKELGVLDNWPFHYHVIGTEVLAYEHLKPLGLRSMSLGSVCCALGISNEGAHTAMADAYRSKQVWDKLCRATCFHRMWWKRRISLLNAEEDRQKEKRQ